MGSKGMAIQRGVTVREASALRNTVSAFKPVFLVSNIVSVCNVRTTKDLMKENVFWNIMLKLQLSNNNSTK